MKVIALPGQRLPNIVVQHLIQRKLQFFREWERLGSLHNVPLLEGSTSLWKDALQALLVKIKVSTFENFTDKAKQSSTRNSYRLLQHDLKDKNYFHDRHCLDKISTIFKVRGELVHLNYQPYRTDRSPDCTLCNLRVTEDVRHFIGTCPILKEIRRNHWGRNLLTANEVVEILNGQDWNKLYSFMKFALKYRSQILSEAF